MFVNLFFIYSSRLLRFITSENTSILYIINYLNSSSDSTSISSLYIQFFSNSFIISSLLNNIFSNVNNKPNITLDSLPVIELDTKDNKNSNLNLDDEDDNDNYFDDFYE